MDFELWTHPAAGSFAIERMTASVERTSATVLRLRYETVGRIGLVVLPAPAEPMRTDRLWEATCFELFLRGAMGNDYREFNFSPSGRWAAYQFDAYRCGMTQAALPAAPEIVFEVERERMVLEVVFSLDLPDEPYDFNLTAVVEEVGGMKSLWAVSHGGETPDFHHPAGYTARLR